MSRGAEEQGSRGAEGQGSREAERLPRSPAPLLPCGVGHPGIEPRWQTARKVGVGTAYSARSRVWFTLSQGILTEVYYPRVDIANTRDLQLLVTNGRTFVHEEQRDLQHEVYCLDDGVPAYRLVNTDPAGRYRLIKHIVTDPDADALMMQVVFEALRGRVEDYALYLLLNPQIKNQGWHNFARVLEVDEQTVLLAWREDIALALVTSAPVVEASCGFVGFSDGWQDLHDNFQMDWTFDTADDGNVALTAQIALAEASRDRGQGSAVSSQFTVALGFGPTADQAVTTALTTLAKPYADVEAAYRAGWCAYLRSLDLERLSAVSGDEGRLARTSAMVLATHEDKTYPGAHIASLSIPWGEQVTAVETGGYHLVWPRDLYHMATARLALGDMAAACRTLTYLADTQRPDGAWPQNFWVGGTPYWHGLQLDEVAFPVILAWRLQEADALDDFDAWPMVHRAALFIARNGPVTPQERWEENAGYSPSTLAAEIAALVCAAEFAMAAGEEDLARYFLDVADYWATHIEDWTFTHCGELLPGHPEYYERIASLRPDDLDQAGTECRVFLPVRNRPGELQVSQCCLVDPSFLDLVRYGLRAPDDFHVLKTLAVVNVLLRNETPCGPVWHRYNGDGYGEREDGSPYDGTGIGRAWPLLTGERAHFALAADRPDQAKRLLEALECFANAGGLLPEQVWDTADVPERDLFLGRGTGAATPLAWTHAEYVKLLRSLADGRVFDRVAPVYERYVCRGERSDPSTSLRAGLVICKFNHKVRAIRADQRLRLEVYAPAELHWSADEWTTVHHGPMAEIAPGVWAREFPSCFFSPGRALRFTYYWPQAGRWEGRDFVIGVV